MNWGTAEIEPRVRMIKLFMDLLPLNLIFISFYKFLLDMCTVALCRKL